MQITMNSNVGAELKEALEAAGKTAARFIVNGFGCRGPLFDIELSDKAEGDASFDVNGVLFVVEKHLEIGLRNPEVIKRGSGFSIKRTSCGC